MKIRFLFFIFFQCLVGYSQINAGDIESIEIYASPFNNREGLRLNIIESATEDSSFEIIKDERKIAALCSLETKYIGKCKNRDEYSDDRLLIRHIFKNDSVTYYSISYYSSNRIFYYKGNKKCAAKYDIKLIDGINGVVTNDRVKKILLELKRKVVRKW